MFEFLNTIPYCEDTDVLISFHQDIINCVSMNYTPQDILSVYLSEFPEFSKCIIDQYKEEKSIGFPIQEEFIDDYMNMGLDEKQEFLFIVSQDSLKNALEYFNNYLEKMYLETHPNGKLLLDIQERIEYLDKYYTNKKLGFNAQLKDW